MTATSHILWSGVPGGSTGLRVIAARFCWRAGGFVQHRIQVLVVRVAAIVAGHLAMPPDRRLKPKRACKQSGVVLPRHASARTIVAGAHLPRLRRWTHFTPAHSQPAAYASRAAG